MSTVESTFSDYLNQIKYAIYGKEVRLAIANAMQSVWDHSGTAAIEAKMDKASPTGTGSFSMNRAAGTEVGSGSTTIGTNCEAKKACSFAGGDGSVSNTNRSFAFGKQSKCLYTLRGDTASTDSVAMGYECITYGAANFAGGKSSVSRGYASFAFGDVCEAGSDDLDRETIYTGHAFAVGYHASATGTYSSAIGNYVSATGNSQFVCGRYNETDSNAIFIVGAGSGDSNRSNALTIDYNGNAAIGRHVEFDNSVHGQFVCGRYNSPDPDALFIVGTGSSNATLNAITVKNNGDTVCTGGLYSTYKANAPLVECTNCIAYSSVSSSEINASGDVNLVDIDGNVDFSVRDFREAVDNYTLSMDLQIGNRDISDPFTDNDLELCEYLSGLIGGRHYTPSELYSLYIYGAVVRMNITMNNGRKLSFTLNDAGPLGTNGQLNFMFSKNGLGSISTITLISNSAQTHYTQEIYTNKQIS